MAAFFNNTTQNAMDGNIKDTPPIITVPKPEDRATLETRSAANCRAARQAGCPQGSRACRLRYVAGRRRTSDDSAAARADRRTESACAARTRVKATSLKFVVDGQERRPSALRHDSVSGQPELPAAKALQSQTATPAGDSPKPATSRRIKPSPRPHGSSFRRTKSAGAIVARMDNAQQLSRLGFLGAGRTSSARTSSMPGQTDALKVVGKTPVASRISGPMSRVTYDGSGKAAGVKIFVNGVQQDDECRGRQAQITIRTNVPLKIGQRSNSERAQRVIVARRSRLRPSVGDQLKSNNSTGTPLAVNCWPSRPTNGLDAEKNELFHWWLITLDKPYPRTATPSRDLHSKSEAAIKARGTIAHVMNEKIGRGRWPLCSSAASTTNAETR